MRTIKLSDLTNRPRAARARLRKLYGSKKADDLPTRIGGRWVFPLRQKTRVTKLIED